MRQPAGSSPISRRTSMLLGALACMAMARGAAAQRPPDDAELSRPFTLVDQDGRTVTDAQFRGKWLLVFFGYTHCPDICPATLGDIAAAFDELDPAKREKIRALFITIDPERDTPQVMKDYIDAFKDQPIVGLSGTPQQVAAVVAAYRIRVKRIPSNGGDYAMSHPSGIYILDPEGHFVRVVPASNVARHLAQLVS